MRLCAYVFQIRVRHSARSNFHFSPKKNKFQSGPRVVKRCYTVCSTHSIYVYLWHTIWFHAKKSTKTWDRETPLAYIFWTMSALGFRGYCPWKISIKNCAFYEKITFSSISLSTKKKCSGSYMLKFDDTDLLNSLIELLYPKDFRGTPKVDLVSTVWRTAPFNPILVQ